MHVPRISPLPAKRAGAEEEAALAPHVRREALSPTQPRHMSSATESASIDIKRYDRQIRLWGLETQTGLHGARILMLRATGLGARAPNAFQIGMRATAPRAQRIMEQISY